MHTFWCVFAGHPDSRRQKTLMKTETFGNGFKSGFFWKTHRFGVERWKRRLLKTVTKKLTDVIALTVAKFQVPLVLSFSAVSVWKKNTAKTLMWAEIFCFVFACMKTFENVVVSSRSLFKMQHWSISAHTTYDKFELGHNIALPLPAPPSLSLKGTDSSDVSVFEKRNWKNVFRSH